MAHSTRSTVIAPNGAVTDVREAGEGLLAGGVELKGGGRAWDVALTDTDTDELGAAGAIIYDRDHDKTMTGVLMAHGYTEKTYTDS